jgi:hypothetical protein
MARVPTSDPSKKSLDNKNNNFASLYGGATIIERNIEAENAKFILDDNNDKYNYFLISFFFFFFLNQNQKKKKRDINLNKNKKKIHGK